MFCPFPSGDLSDRASWTHCCQAFRILLFACFWLEGLAYLLSQIKMFWVRHRSTTLGQTQTLLGILQIASWFYED
jgi:hypothetical protein